MPGFDVNRFVRLDDWLAIELKCGICLNIFDKAVDTQCGHTFCTECIQQSIRNRLRGCPECRQPMNGRERLRNTNNDYIIISDEPVLKTNRRIDGIISKLKIRCDFEPKGCQQVMELSLLSTHLEECNYNLCLKCDFKVGKVSEHDCIQLLRNDRNRYKNAMNEFKEKLILSESVCKLFKSKNKILEVEVKRLKESNDLNSNSSGLRSDDKSDDSTETSDVESDNTTGARSPGKSYESLCGCDSSTSIQSNYSETESDSNSEPQRVLALRERSDRSDRPRRHRKRTASRSPISGHKSKSLHIYNS